jgi:D-beta-D-heptose 7-phosphate kinase/D-beta-D-heptose 1-phosphate adenosyltransferase
MSNHKPNILVIGDLMLDRYIIGEVERISPEAPVPVVKVSREEFRLGGAANVAHNINSLGMATTLLGSLGTDSAADRFGKLCKDKGIHLDAAIGLQSTTVKARVIAGKQQVVRLDYEDQQVQQSKLDRSMIDLLNKHVEDAGVLVFSDYGKGLLSDDLLQSGIRRAKELELPVLIDPKRDNWNAYRGATLISPNFKELQQAIGKQINNSDQEVQAAAQELRQEFDLEYVLVTRSEKGMSLVSESEAHHVPTEAREVFDISGAGDTAIATLAVSIAKGKPYAAAVEIANRAAGIVIAKFGTAVVEPGELGL